MTDGAWAGGEFGERARCVLAPNANMMTLDGTNTWVLREPGASRSVVIDPGPEITEHLDSVASYAGAVAVVLLTHGHLDHSEAARTFAERMGCGVRALDPQHRLGEEGLGDGDVVEVDGLEVHVVGTPGHTSDSLSFVLPQERAVLTGDTVLGRGTTVVAHPDGRLGAYLDSLHRLHALAEEREVTRGVAGPRPGDRRRAWRPSTSTSRTARNASTRCVRRCGRCRSSRRPRASPRTSSPARSWRPSTPMSTPPCGALPSSACERRSTTCAADGLPRYAGKPALPMESNPWGATEILHTVVIRQGRQRARRANRSMSMITTERGSRRSQPREAKSASALLTVSREAPTSWASSSWVRSWWT